MARETLPYEDFREDMNILARKRLYDMEADKNISNVKNSTFTRENIRTQIFLKNDPNDNCMVF